MKPHCEGDTLVPQFLNWVRAGELLMSANFPFQRGQECPRHIAFYS